MILYVSAKQVTIHFEQFLRPADLHHFLMSYCDEELTGVSVLLNERNSFQITNPLQRDAQLSLNEIDFWLKSFWASQVIRN